MDTARPTSTSYAPPRIRTVRVDVPLHAGQAPMPIMVPVITEEETFRFLCDVGDGATAGVAYGSVLEPIRTGYKRQLEQVEMLIRQRRAALGTSPTEYELRGLAQWAARRRTATAGLWRILLPVTGVGLEVRDWRVYGKGGRTFDNLLARNARVGRTGAAAYEAIMGSATRSNAGVNASIARSARLLKGSGDVLGVAGLGVSAYDIWQAPAGQRGQVAERHAVGFAGGLIGAEVGAGLLAVGRSADRYAARLARPGGQTGRGGRRLADRWPRLLSTQLSTGGGRRPSRHRGQPASPEQDAGGTGGGDGHDASGGAPDRAAGSAWRYPGIAGARAGIQAAASVGVAPGE